MADLPEAQTWEGVYQIEQTDPVLGGLNGASNKPLRNLANRTAWLKQQIELLQTLVSSNDGSLDDLQEIVDFIKLNRSDLDALTIASIAGLQGALDGLTASVQQAAGSSAVFEHSFDITPFKTYPGTGNATSWPKLNLGGETIPDYVDTILLTPTGTMTTGDKAYIGGIDLPSNVQDHVITIAHKPGYYSGFVADIVLGYGAYSATTASANFINADDANVELAYVDFSTSSPGSKQKAVQYLYMNGWFYQIPHYPEPV